jgi:endoglycosylceramidase
VTTLVNQLGAAGIWTLIDNHQDVYARKICGEGVPNFYAQNLSDTCEGLVGEILQLLHLCTPFSSFHYTNDQNGNPLISNCTSKMFATYYSTPEAADGFARIYQDVYEYKQRFIKFWNVTSLHFAGNENVVGYDLLNEPLAANMYTQPWTAIPGVNDHINLERLYQDTQTVLRENDDESIIFFEPIQGDLLPILGGMVFPTGFSSTPGGSDYLDRVVLNDHSYCCQMDVNACSIGEPPLSIASECSDFNNARVTSRKLDADALGVGLIISEFGACFNTENCVAEIQGVTNACDSNLAGWAYWMFKQFGDFTTSGQSDLTGGEGFYVNNTLQTGKVKALARTYLPFYQGVPEYINFNAKTGDFMANFTLLPTVTQPSVLFASSEFYYQNGVNIVVYNSAFLTPTINNINENYYIITFNDPVVSLTSIIVTAK